MKRTLLIVLGLVLLLLAGGRVAHLECYLSGRFGGQAVRSCLMPVQAVAGQEVTTIEGLGSPERPHPLQAAFVEEQAVQCGYCTPGIVMAAKAVLDQTPHPTDAELKQALAGILCRCGTHDRVIRAVRRAAATMGGR